MKGFYIILFLIMFFFACILISKAYDKNHRMALTVTAVTYLLSIGGFYSLIFIYLLLLTLFALIFFINKLKNITQIERTLVIVLLIVIMLGILSNIIYFHFLSHVFFLWIIVVFGCISAYFIKGNKNRDLLRLLVLLTSYIIIEIIAKLYD